MISLCDAGGDRFEDDLTTLEQKYGHAAFHGRGKNFSYCPHRCCGPCRRQETCSGRRVETPLWTNVSNACLEVRWLGKSANLLYAVLAWGENDPAECKSDPITI